MSKSNETQRVDNVPVQIPLRKKNYMFLAAGFALVALGFVLMYVGPENHGNYKVIYSFGKTTLPVLLIMAGFAVTGFGIMKRFNTEAQA